MAGYIKIPRDLFASEEWLSPRVFGKVDAQLDLLQLASWSDDREVRCKYASVVLKKGQLLTSIRALADRWSWSVASVHRFLSSLRQPQQGCIRVQIETAPEAGKTLITIVDYNRWDYPTDETAFGTHRETPTETHFGTPTETYDDYESACNSDSCEGAVCGSETQTETAFGTHCETLRETPNGTQYNKVENKRDNTENKHTHTVDTVKGGCRGEIPTYSQGQVEAALDLMQWIANNQPALYSHYTSSINPRVICDLLTRYDRDDVEYIISSMAAKQAFSPTAPFGHTFEVFARNDYSVKSRAEKQAELIPEERRYTYDQMCDEATKRGITTAAFTPIYNGGPKPAYWIRKTVC